MKELRRIIELFQSKTAKEAVNNLVTEYIDDKIKRNRNRNYICWVFIFLLITLVFMDIKDLINISFIIFLVIMLGFISGLSMSVVFTLKEISYRIMKFEYKKYIMEKVTDSEK